MVKIKGMQTQPVIKWSPSDLNTDTLIKSEVLGQAELRAQKPLFK